MFTERSVHFSHSKRHHIPEDTVSTVSTSNLTTYSSTPKSVSYCQLFSIIHKVPGCCHVAACCRHSAGNNTAMLPHPAACNLITPLLRLSSRNGKPCAKSQVETSGRAVVALFRFSPLSPPLPLSPPAAVSKTVYQYQLCKAQWLPYVPLAFTLQTILLLTHCVCFLCIDDAISSSHFSVQFDDFPCNGGYESSL